MRKSVQYKKKYRERLQDIEKRLKEELNIDVATYLENQFVYREQDIIDCLGLDNYNAVNELWYKYRNMLDDKKYQQIFLENRRKKYFDENMPEKFIEAVVEFLDKCGVNIEDEDNQLMLDIDKMSMEYIDEWFIKSRDIYEEQKGKVFDNRISFEDILERKVRTRKLFEEIYLGWDFQYWSKIYRLSVKMSKNDINKFAGSYADYIFSFENIKIWKDLLMKDVLWEEHVSRQFVEEMQILIKSKDNFFEINQQVANILGCEIYKMRLGRTELDAFAANYKRMTFSRCLLQILDDFIDVEKNIPRMFKPQIEENISRGAFSGGTSKLKEVIRKSLGQIINIKDYLDFISIFYGGGVYEIRYEIESNTRLRLENKVNVKIDSIEGKEKTWIYDKDSCKVICVARKEVDESMFVDKKGSSRIYGEINVLYQERILADKDLISMMNAKSRNHTFKKCFNGIQFLRQDLSEYESYIIEKNSGLMLAWIIYNGTRQLADIASSEKGAKKEISKLIEQITVSLNNINNVNIRLQVADELMGILNIILIKNDIDVVEILEIFVEEINCFMEEFNKSYRNVYEILLFVFSKEGLENGILSPRIKLLQGIECYLGNVFRNISEEFNLLYKNNGNMEGVCKNIIHKSVIYDLLNCDTRQKQHLWFRPIYESVHIKEK